MTTEHQRRAMQALEDSFDLDGEQLAAYLAEIGRDDPALRAEVESLIAADRGMDDFLNAPVFRWANERREAESNEEAMIGRWVGPYRIVRELGRGGMGAVYLAERADGQFEKQVAIKLLKRGMESDEMLRRFGAERQILAALDHPNIARLLDGGTTEDGRPYLVMEYVAGAPIDEHCRERELDTTARLRLFQRVCEAVAYAHRHLIVHRDLKPRNILITTDGATELPKLLDFGIAKLLEPGMAGTDATATGCRPMTPAYASPEQARGASVTTASDVYSLGVVLYELLTAERPYQLDGCSSDEAARVICEQEPKRPSLQAQSGEPRHRLSSELDDIVLMALRKEPERRYGSVRELSEDIERHLDGLPVKALPDTFGYRAGKFVRRNRVVVAAAVIVVMTLLVSILALARAARIAQAAFQREVSQRKIAEEERSKAEAQRALAEQAKSLAETQRQRAEREWTRAEAALAKAGIERERAESEKARAERRFNDVWKLSNAMLFKLHDEIKKLPGSMRARESLVNIGLESYDSLAREANGNASLQRELAGAYDKLGDLQGNSSAGDLGNPAAALQSYRKALALREAQARNDPSNVHLRHYLALSYRGIGQTFEVMNRTAEALENYRQALIIVETLPVAESHAEQTPLELMSLHNRIGYLLRLSGKTAEAAYHLRKEEEIFESLLKSRGITALEDAGAFSEDALRPDAQLLLPLNRNKELGIYQRLLSIAEKRSAQIPGVKLADRSAGWLHQNIASALASGGKYDQALDHYRQATAIFQELSDRDPANARDRRSLSNGLRGIAEMLFVSRKEPESLDYFRKAVAIDEELSKHSPAYAPSRIYLSHGYKRIAHILADDGKFKEALEYYDKAFAIREEMVEQDPNNLKAQSDLAQLHYDIADSLRWGGDLSGALERYHKGLAITEAIFAKDPFFDTSRSNFYFRIGWVLARQGDVAGAIENHRQHVVIREAEAAREPENINRWLRAAAAYLETGRFYAGFAADEKQPVEKRIEYWREARAHLQRRLAVLQELRARGALPKNQASRLEETVREIAKCEAELNKLL
jgi:tetratricopeptide (TPR) repeat protein